MPETAHRKPISTKIVKVFLSTLTPDSRAASRLPPIAYAYRPNRVLFENTDHDSHHRQDQHRDRTPCTGSQRHIHD